MRVALRKGNVEVDVYGKAWNEYKQQQKKVKILVWNAKVKDERRQLDELKRRVVRIGTDSSREKGMKS